MKVFSQLSVAALASYATAASVDVLKRETPLSVELTAAGNSEVKVVLTNNGDKTLNLLSKGTFLDEENPIEKVTMYSSGGSKFYILYSVVMHFRHHLSKCGGGRRLSFCSDVIGVAFRFFSFMIRLSHNVKN